MPSTFRSGIFPLPFAIVSSCVSCCLRISAADRSRLEICSRAILKGAYFEKKINKNIFISFLFPFQIVINSFFSFYPKSTDGFIFLTPILYVSPCYFSIIKSLGLNSIFNIIDYFQNSCNSFVSYQTLPNPIKTLLNHQLSIAGNVTKLNSLLANSRLYIHYFRGCFSFLFLFLVLNLGTYGFIVQLDNDNQFMYIHRCIDISYKLFAKIETGRNHYFVFL